MKGWIKDMLYSAGLMTYISVTGAEIEVTVEEMLNFISLQAILLFFALIGLLTIPTKAPTPELSLFLIGVVVFGLIITAWKGYMLLKLKQVNPDMKLSD